MARLMLVEDDARVGRLLESALRADGHDVTWERTGHSALAEAARGELDLILLDLDVPDLDGPDVCRELRVLQPAGVLVIFTAAREQKDVVVALRAGADACLTKPFGVPGLMARIGLYLSRRPAPSQPGPESYVCGDLQLHLRARRCVVAGDDLPLRAKEFDLLARLMRETGQAVSRQTLMSDVWDENWFGSTKTLDVHIAAVRRRLSTAAGAHEPPARLPRITTLRGHGYRLEPPPRA